MSKKTLNTDNLEALGAKKLADLLIEVSTGSADIKRRLRLELSHNLGSSELVHAIRKRLVTLRKSNSFVSWRKRKALIKDIDTQVIMIVKKVAPEDPPSAFELLWQFIEIAPSLYERVDDSRGDVGDVFRAAILHFEAIAPLALVKVETLAARVWNVIQDNGYGEWDGIIGILSDSLGATGLDQLRQHVENFAAQPMDAEAEQHDLGRVDVRVGAGKPDCGAQVLVLGMGGGCDVMVRRLQTVAAAGRACYQIGPLPAVRARSARERTGSRPTRACAAPWRPRGGCSARPSHSSHGAAH